MAIINRADFPENIGVRVVLQLNRVAIQVDIVPRHVDIAESDGFVMRQFKADTPAYHMTVVITKAEVGAGNSR